MKRETAEQFRYRRTLEKMHEQAQIAAVFVAAATMTAAATLLCPQSDLSGYVRGCAVFAVAALCLKFGK